MKKYLPIYLYGGITIFAGAFLLFSKWNSFEMVKLVLGFTLSLASVIVFLSAFSPHRKHIHFTYHEMHALAMLVYGISTLLFCNTPEMLIYYTAFLLFFYTFSELIFCNWLFNSGQKISYNVLVVRLALGILIGLGTLVSMNYSQYTLIGFGVIFIMIGVNILFYVPILKGKELDAMEPAL